jgi:ribosomal protein L37AE/L43A
MGTYDKSAFDLIVSLRGGLPERCDFCKKPYTEDRYPIPEEAGEWTCNECVARWNKAEREMES